MYKRSGRFLSLLIALLLLSTMSLTAVMANPTSDIKSTQGFRKHVTLSGVREHQAAFQAIAAANGNTRLAGTAGYDASAAYVMAKAQAAGLSVTYQEFDFLLVSDVAAPLFERVSPIPTTYVDGVEYRTMSYSGSGDVTAALASPGGDILGCNAADFAGFPAGRIALISRGTCTFRIKATNALNAGAVGVIIYNNTDGLLAGTLGADDGLSSGPVVGVTQQLGLELLDLVPVGVIMHMEISTIAEVRTTGNVIAETPGGDPNNVVVIGAHLDSVSSGPGINDNGSGSAAILEIAEVFADQERSPRNKMRFIWWGAEEQGLVGSNYYVSNLTSDELDKIRLNLNFDMVGSPNFVRFVYDGNNSSFPAGVNGVQPGPAGSGAIEEVFVAYFDAMGLPVEATPFNGRSDYGPFILNGVPAGGLFTGAEGIKTASQAAVYGGTAGVAYDPCYHLACDTFANNSDVALDQMSDAIAHAVLYFSRFRFDKQPLVDPASFAGAGVAGGGGGLHDHNHELVDR